MVEATKTLKIAAVGDIHFTRDSGGRFERFFSQVNEQADVLVLCGDLTDYGLTEEAEGLAKELNVVRIPMVGVLGNHDFESGQPEVVKEILCKAGVKILDGDACEIKGVGFAGVKGFAGGFGAGVLGAWGEGAIKTFVQEAVNESLKLEAALARLRTPQRVAVLHYAPIKTTVEGEPVEIFPFLGCSRLEEPLLRYPVSAVFHGHAHRGYPEGRTINDIPVYNVAMPLMMRTFPKGPAYRLLEIPVETAREPQPVGS